MKFHWKNQRCGLAGVVVVVVYNCVEDLFSSLFSFFLWKPTRICIHGMGIGNGLAVPSKQGIGYSVGPAGARVVKRLRRKARLIYGEFSQTQRSKALIHE